MCKCKQFHKPSQELIGETVSVPTHNKFPEQVLGTLDALMKFRPAATTLTNKWYIMFSVNKTADWLKSLPEETKKKKKKKKTNKQTNKKQTNKKKKKQIQI